MALHNTWKITKSVEKKALFDTLRLLEKEPPTFKGMDSLPDPSTKPDSEGPFVTIYGMQACMVNVSRILFEGWKRGIKDREALINFTKEVENVIWVTLETILGTGKVPDMSKMKIMPELEPWHKEET